MKKTITIGLINLIFINLSFAQENQPIKLDGNIRAYFFERDFAQSSIPMQQSFSLGGRLNALAQLPITDWSLGGTLYTAQPLGINSKNLRKVDRSLPHSPVTVLGQSYLQYDNKISLLRIGNQVITTPWMNEADSRMIPATYRGLLAKFSPYKDLNLMALRVTRFKGRISRHFSRTNLYHPMQATASAINAFVNQTTKGAQALGIQFKPQNLNAQIWGYQFYDYSKLVYADVRYSFPYQKRLKPLMGLQAGQEWNNGYLGNYRTHLMGALIGAEIHEGSLILAYNTISKKSGAFKNGDIISPYTSGYAADPLYTTSMTAGLIEKSAGHAYKITGQYTLLDKQLKLLASYAKYITDIFPKTSEKDFDITFTPKKINKLSLRYRLGVVNSSRFNDKFNYHRVMFQYTFD